MVRPLFAYREPTSVSMPAQVCVYLSLNDMYPDLFLFKAPANGIGMKIWTCFANLAAQTWTYGSDNKLVLSVQGTPYQFSL